MVVCDEGRGNEKEEKKGKEKMGKKGMYEVQIFCRVRIKGRMNWEGGLCHNIITITCADVLVIIFSEAFAMLVCG